jgi:hypothetical protein
MATPKGRQIFFADNWEAELKSVRETIGSTSRPSKPIPSN